MRSEVKRDQARPTSPGLPPGMPLIRVMAMPADANPNGDIFGGWLLTRWTSPAAGWPLDVPGAAAQRWRSTAWSFTSRSSSETRSAATASW